jgi:hypothetical protein
MDKVERMPDAIATLEQHMLESLADFEELKRLAGQSPDALLDRLDAMDGDDVRHMVFSLAVAELRMLSPGEAKDEEKA